MVTTSRDAEMVLTLSHLIERYMIELGAEGRLVQLQMEELLRNVREDRAGVLADYLPDPSPARLEIAREALIALPSDELISLESIGTILGYAPHDNVLETYVHPRGVRMLQKVPRVSQEAMDAVVKKCGGLAAIFKAPVEELAKLEGVGPSRARDIKEGLLRLRDIELPERWR
jgi:diadenylate cyclase